MDISPLRHQQVLRRVKRYVEVRKNPDGGYRVWLVVGVQSFELGYQASKARAEWMAKMLRKALAWIVVSE